MTVEMAASPLPIVLIVSALTSAISSILAAIFLLQSFLALISVISASHCPLVSSTVLVTKVSPLTYSFLSSESALN